MNQPQELYDRILFPQTVTCTGCGQQLPPAIFCWMVNGHIHCTECKDKVAQHEAQRRQLMWVQQLTDSLQARKNPRFAPEKDEFAFSDEFDLDLNVQ